MYVCLIGSIIYYNLSEGICEGILDKIIRSGSLENQDLKVPSGTHLGLDKPAFTFEHSQTSLDDPVC